MFGYDFAITSGNLTNISLIGKKYSNCSILVFFQDPMIPLPANVQIWEQACDLAAISGITVNSFFLATADAYQCSQPVLSTTNTPTTLASNGLIEFSNLENIGVGILQLGSILAEVLAFPLWEPPS